MGTSEEGRRLECIHLSSNVRQKRPLLRPQVKFVANIHGDEVVGRELLLALARYLVDNYQTDNRVRQILESTDLSLVPRLSMLSQTFLIIEHLFFTASTLTVSRWKAGKKSQSENPVTRHPSPSASGTTSMRRILTAASLASWTSVSAGLSCWRGGRGR